jgi:hypothetical protein
MQEDRPDVVFISFEEPNADENFARLLAFAPHAKRVHHVEGEYEAHMAALRLASTPRFFIVDGDSWILDGFAFVAPEASQRPHRNYMWKSRNAVNGLELMNGSVKFVSGESLASLRKDAADLIMSMNDKWYVLDQVASETRFNTSSFLAWRCGFRECAKLASANLESNTPSDIIRVWQTKGAEAPHGRWCMLGARMGAEFGRQFAGTERLNVINNIRRLEKVFELVQQSPEAPR